MAKLSPMMEQYIDIKAQNKDRIVFFRLGDFYEMFFDDAVIASKELELTLTGRDCGMAERAPMCGVPFHSSSVYIKRLIDKGYKVAICEQVEDPATTKGIVKREVVRVVSAGTVFEESLLPSTQNNYIATVELTDDMLCVCFADVSTGETVLVSRACKDPEHEFVAELLMYKPSEIIGNIDVTKLPQTRNYLNQNPRCVCSTFDSEGIDLAKATDAIYSHFKIVNLQQIEINDDPQVCRVLGALILYLNQTHAQGAQRIKSVTCRKENQYMNLDMTARRNLELTETMRGQDKKGSLLWVLDETKTAMGKRYLHKTLDQPLLQVSEIILRQNAVAELVSQSILLSDLRIELSGVQDLERLMTRVLYSTASPRELRALASSAEHLPAIIDITVQFQSKFLTRVWDNLDDMDDVQTLVENAIVEQPPVNLKDGGYIREGFHQTLDQLRELCNNSKGFIQKIEQEERDKTGIKTLKIKYNRVFGYYIEVTKSNLDQVPEHYIRKQTLANAERYITQELKDLEHQVLSASEKIRALESEIFQEVRDYIATKIDRIQATAAALAQLDFVASLAQVALVYRYVCPQITADGKIDIVKGRHPVVEAMADMPMFVPNDVKLDQKDNRMLVITGPNMAGKSTYMRQVAVLVIMAQIGSFVPAQSASIGVVDQIFTRVGASDDLTSGQSTFMVEMSELAHILKHATRKSLVILDEIGRGTSTFDGMSIARAALEYIVQQKSLKCKTLFATHYHELTSLEAELDGVKNYNIAVNRKGDEIIFLRKIQRGGADDSYGIDVAKLAGVPDKVVLRAREILTKLEEENTVTIVKEVVREDESQTSFNQYVSELEQHLRHTDVDGLTPIQALNLLYELKNMLS